MILPAHLWQRIMGPLVATNISLVQCMVWSCIHAVLPGISNPISCVQNYLWTSWRPWYTTADAGGAQVWAGLWLLLSLKPGSGMSGAYLLSKSLLMLHRFRITFTWSLGGLTCWFITAACHASRHVSCVPLLLLGVLPHEQLGLFCGSYDLWWCHLSLGTSCHHK